MSFNEVLKSALPKGQKGHPDIHYVPLVGMAQWMPQYLKKSDGKHLNVEGNRKLMKNIKSKIYSDLQRECMRDIRYRLGADWLPSVMGLVESSRAEALPDVR